MKYADLKEVHIHGFKMQNWKRSYAYEFAKKLRYKDVHVSEDGWVH